MNGGLAPGNSMGDDSPFVSANLATTGVRLPECLSEISWLTYLRLFVPKPKTARNPAKWHKYVQYRHACEVCKVVRQVAVVKEKKRTVRRLCRDCYNDCLDLRGQLHEQLMMEVE